MKILTFQSNEVLNIVINEGTYKADITRTREKRDYLEDIKQLGVAPIWGFRSLLGRDFTPADFLDATLFQRYTCEMSLNEDDGLSRFLLLELEIPDGEVKVGLTHNSYLGAVVFPRILSSHLRAVYRLVYDQHWFYPRVETLFTYYEDTLFPEKFQCSKPLRTVSLFDS